MKTTYPTHCELQSPWNATLIPGTELESFNSTFGLPELSSFCIVEGFYYVGFQSQLTALKTEQEKLCLSP